MRELALFAGANANEFNADDGRYGASEDSGKLSSSQAIRNVSNADETRLQGNSTRGKDQGRETPDGHSGSSGGSTGGGGWEFEPTVRPSSGSWDFLSGSQA